MIRITQVINCVVVAVVYLYIKPNFISMNFKVDKKTIAHFTMGMYIYIYGDVDLGSQRYTEQYIVSFIM